MSGPPCSRSRSPDTCSRGCASRIGRRAPAERSGRGRPRSPSIACSRRDDSSCSRWRSCFCSWPPRRSISRVPGVLALAGFIARAAAATLGVVGISAHAAANVLWTPRGGFLVTQECISTPLIPVYLAAVCAYSTDVAAAASWASSPRCRSSSAWASCGSWSSPCPMRRGLAALPGARLLSIAPRRGGRVPRRAVAPRRQSGAGPRAGRRHRGRAVRLPARPALHARGHISGRARRSTIRRERSRSSRRSRSASISRSGSRPSSRVGWRRFVAGLAVLGLTQTAGLLALHALASHAGLTAHVRDVRGWAVAGPRADLRRGGQRCPAASLRSPRSRPWPRSSRWRSPPPCFARRPSACSAWRSSGATTIRSR